MDGVFNEVGIERFVDDAKLSHCGSKYTIVSVIGSRGSGKSLLMNRLFRTSFRVMDDSSERDQSTKGIWIARSPALKKCTLVMDLEGFDGMGEDGSYGTTFEKQSALFALAVSDIIIVNMWDFEFGHKDAGYRHILRFVIQAMRKSFSPRRGAFMFVVRDQKSTCLETLAESLHEDLFRNICETVMDKQAVKNNFAVYLETLPSYVEESVLFSDEVFALRMKFMNSIPPGGLALDGFPALQFCYYAQQIWKFLKENQYLHIPELATMSCEKIANDVYNDFLEDEEWHGIQAAVQVHQVPNFVKRLMAILNKHFHTFDATAFHYEEGFRYFTLVELFRKLMQLIQPCHERMVKHFVSETLDDFKKAFDDAWNGEQGFSVAKQHCTDTFMTQFEQKCAGATINRANWDHSSEAADLRHDMDAHADFVHSIRLSQLIANYENKFKEALAGPVLEAILDEANGDTWLHISKHYKQETKIAASELSSALSVFEMDEATKKEMLLKLEAFAKEVVESKAKEEAGRVVARMRDRFLDLFSHDSDSLPRVWTGKEDIQEIIRTARLSCIKLLSVLAAVRLDGEKDDIENELSRAFISTSKSISSAELLSSSTWEEIPPSRTILAPVQCNALWIEFINQTENDVTQAIVAREEASKRNNSRIPPLWAVAAIAVLGFSKFMTTLRNPLFPCIIVFVCYHLLKYLWVRLDLSNERHGALHRIISLSSKVLNMLKRLAPEGGDQTNLEQKRPNG